MKRFVKCFFKLLTENFSAWRETGHKKGYPCRLFFLCTIFGPKPTSTTSPQRLHLISSTVLPGGISSMSKMCRPHFGFGHLILSTDNRLPALIWNKGTKHEVFLPGSLLSFVLYVINLNGLLFQKSQELLPLHVTLQIPILVLGLHDIIYNFHPIRLFRKAP